MLTLFKHQGIVPLHRRQDKKRPWANNRCQPCFPRPLHMESGQNGH